MNVSEFEEALVTLTRYVRTPEGAQKFGVPIGSPITADAVAYAKSHGFDGMKVPEDAHSSKKPNHMAGTISGKAAAAKSAPKPKAAPKLKLKISKSSLSGNKHFSVGGSKYTAPNNSKLIKSKNQDGLAYVVTPDGKVHAFNSAGEITIPATLNTVFQAKFGPDFEGDENYSAEEFEATSAASSLDSQKVGAVLNDSRGNPQFKKTGPDSWEHVDLGVKLKDDDLQALYDEGELLPDTNDEDTAVAEETFANVDATNFSELSMAETVSALDGMKAGQKVTLATKDSGDRVFVKQEDGNWLAEGTNPAGEPWQPTESSVLGFVKDFLTVGEGEKKDNPLEGNPLDSNDKPKLGKGDKPTSEWVTDAATGSEMVFSSGTGDGKTTWTKQDNQSWTNQNGASMSPAGMLDALPMGGDNLKITKDGNDLTADGLDKSKMSPQMRAKVETDEAAGLHDAPEPEKIRGKKPTQRSSSSLVPGEGDYTELATTEDIGTAEPGDKALVSFADGKMVSEYAMQDDGSWLNVDDDTDSFGALAMSAMAEGDGAEQVYLHKDKAAAPPERQPDSPVSSTDVAFHEGMGGLDVGDQESEHYLIPGEHDYSEETTAEDITNAQPGDKILVAVDPDFEAGQEEDPHYEANELLEKNPDGSWKSLTYPTNEITEHDLLSDVQNNEFEYGSTQLYTFKGNSTNVESSTPPQEESLPTGVPAGSIKIEKTSLDSVGVGAHVFEFQPAFKEALEYEKTDDPEMPWSAQLPSGLVVPLKQSYLEDMPSSFYLAPSAEDLAPTESEPPLQEWEKELLAPFDSNADQSVVKTPKVGDTIQGVEDLDAQAPNTALAYTKKDGSQSKYVKLENGSWLTPGGGVMASIQLKGSAKSGKFKVESIPEVAAKAPSGPYAEGEVITKYGHLRDMPVGQTLEMFADNGEYIYDLMKHDDGQWFSVPQEGMTPDHPVLWTPNELALDIIAGRLHYKTPEAPEETSGVMDTQLYSGAPMMSKKDIQDAYSALKNHTSFQVAYGLKALDDKHPLKSKEAQTALKAAALSKYPDLKPKPAVMEYLKDAIGIQDENKSAAMAPDAPKVWLGSKTPKEGVQGFDGGEFTAAEIQGAIDILENYPGKLFKSELNKKGNPLGKLNPNDLVGFDKDKLVTKQKLIDLLKTKLTVNEEMLSHPPVKSMDDLKQLPVGVRVRYLAGDGAYQYYTKIADGQWSMDNPPDYMGPDEVIISEKSFSVSVKGGGVSIESLPEAVPEYAKAPAAVQDKQIDEIQVENFTADDIDWASPGTILVTTKEEVQIKLIKKPGVDDGWTSIEVATGFESPLVFKNNELKAVWEKWGLQLQGQDGPSMNSEKQDGLTPGKYVSGGKAYMVVSADGTGVYVNTKGDVQKLTAKAVKSNYDKGMNKYEGVPDSVPTPTTKKEATKAKPKVVGDIADGTYFAGNPNDPKTSVYEVKGDSVNVYKPAVVSGYKIGQEITSEWMTEASTGAAVKYKWANDKKEIAFTKGSDGLWHSGTDPDAEPLEALPSSYYSYKIASHGLSSEPVAMQKKKVNSLFSQGKFTDANGNSVVPEGYSGAVFYFGASTTIPALLAVQKSLKENEFSSSKELAADLQAKGLFFDKKLMGDFTAKNYGQKTLENYISSISDSISEMTKGLDTDIPESDASSLFEWDDMGQATLPLEVASLKVNSYDVSSTTAYLKAASKAIGDGNIIGQHYGKMDKWDKSAWVSAFQQGDFKKMYALEVAAAAKDGKAHKSGYLHPGYEGNEATNKVAWGAAVPGEISALTNIPGDWTSGNVNASLAEVNNYLIKAQMQNPTFLSNHEKRIWVTAHRTHQKETVDLLSASAALRKKNGESPQSDPISWDDDVKPAKSYDYHFEDTQFPTSNWTSEQAKDYYNDQLAASGGSGATAIADMTEPEALSFVTGLAVGEKVQLGNTKTAIWEKQPSGKWMSHQSPDSPPITNETMALPYKKLTYLGEVTPESVDLAGMSDNKLGTYLSDKPTGSVIYKSDAKLVKTPEGTWKSEVTGNAVDEFDLIGLKAMLSTQPPSNGLESTDLAELKQAWDEAHQTYGSYTAPMYAVQTYFQKKKDAEDAKALIPVYSMKPNQTVKSSTHPTFPYQDQFGNSYWFKPAYANKDGKYRAEAEHLGNQLGKAFGFQTPESQLLEVDGKYGQLQNDAGGIGDMLNFDYSTLTEKQITDIGSEHILDWILDNDDTHGANAQVLANGHIVGIDKGRAFKHYGAWNGLSGNSSMDSNAHTVYSQLFDAIRSGKLDKAAVDKAYLAVQRKAEKMSKVSDQKITDMLAEGMKNREQWDIKYSIDGKPVPKNLAGLTAAVLDRKSKLPEQVQTLWSKVYKDAGFGDLPEKPDNPLGDIISGLDDTRLHEQVFVAESTGKTAMLGGAHVIGGTALLWTDKDTSGNTNLNGEMYLGPKKQKELLDFFISNASTLSPDKTMSVGFGPHDKYADSIIAAAKTVNHHAGDQEYNATTISTFQETSSHLKSDLAEWKPGLTANSSFNGEKSFKFASGANIPMQHVDQYKLMLDYYVPKVESIEKAYAEHGKVTVIDKFPPLNYSKGGEKFVKSDGSSLTKLSGDDYLYVYGVDGSTKVIGSFQADVEDAKAGLYGWNSVEPSPEQKPSSGITIALRSGTHEQHATLDGHTKTVQGTTGVTGSKGTEYEVTLPTGEKIYFRNAGQTNTARGQHGKLSFRADGVETADDSQAAMSRIMAQLNDMGISTEASDETNAELTYWREMYGVLENRSHASGSKYAKAKAKLDVKVKEIGGDSHMFLENLSESMSPDAEAEYWRNLYSEFWPDEVSKMISEDGYLPKFDHQHLEHPELETGNPYWDRFDVSLDDVLKKNKLIASATGGEPTDLVTSGAALGAEERLRQAEDFTGGGKAWSASTDQSYGSSHNVYTRIIAPSEMSGYNAFYNPKLILRTRTYSFNSDNYGKLENRKDSAPSNPLHALDKFAGGSNETSLPHMATLLDGIEIYTFDYAESRNKAIQYLKKLGIEKIRGLPVEDRLVMRNNIKSAIEKVKKSWQEK